MIFDLSLDELSVGQANGNNREACPSYLVSILMISLFMSNTARDCLSARDDCYDGALLRNSAMTLIASRIGCWQLRLACGREGRAQKSP